MAKIKVLLLEDDQTMLSLLNRVLKLEGFDSVSLPDFQKHTIVDWIKNEKPDAIFMDVHLGDLDGIELISEMRSQAIHGSAKVLMTSGLDLKQDCLAAGADGFLMKPFMPSELINWLKNATTQEEV